MAIGRCRPAPDWPLRTPLAAAAALFGVTGAAGFATIGTTMSDIVPGLPVLVALCVLLPRADTNARLRALGAGVLCGLSVGLKLTTAPLFAGAFAAIVAGELPGLRRARTLGRCSSRPAPGRHRSRTRDHRLVVVAELPDAR